MDSADWSFAPLFLAVVGWGVVNYQQNRRESRKEARALIDQSKLAVIDVAVDVVSYYCEGKPELGSEIKWKLEALEVELERVPYFSNVQGPLMCRYIAFADAATGDNFDSHSVVKLPRDAPLLLTLMLERNRLLSELERQFRASYT